MRLIVDSGSTKTDWICIDEKGEILFDTQTKGLNPQVLTEQIIEERVINNFDLYQNRKKISHLYFYGAGCGTESPRKLIKKVFENKHILAFDDIEPQAPIHVLIIPKKHISTINEIQFEDKDLIGEMFIGAKEIAKIKGIQDQGYRTIFNTNEYAGQTVFHIHMHVMGGRRMSWPPG